MTDPDRITIIRCANGHWCGGKSFEMAAEYWHPITEGKGWICDDCFNGMTKEQEFEDMRYEWYCSHPEER